MIPEPCSVGRVHCGPGRRRSTDDGVHGTACRVSVDLAPGRRRDPGGDEGLEARRRGADNAVGPTPVGRGTGAAGTRIRGLGARGRRRVRRPPHTPRAYGADVGPSQRSGGGESGSRPGGGAVGAGEHARRPSISPNPANPPTPTPAGLLVEGSEVGCPLPHVRVAPEVPKPRVEVELSQGTPAPRHLTPCPAPAAPKRCPGRSVRVADERLRTGVAPRVDPSGATVAQGHLLVRQLPRV